MTTDEQDDDAVELPIDGELDLHTFAPREVAALVDDYLDACKERGITDIRIVHGKGKGVLRRTVHAVLERRDDLIAWGLAPPERGGWGATLVTRVGGTPPAGLVAPDAPTEGDGGVEGSAGSDRDRSPRMLRWLLRWLGLGEPGSGERRR